MSDRPVPHYCKIELVLSSDKELYDTEDNISLIKRFLENLGPDLKGWNHNRYYDPRVPDSRPTIELRFRFDSSPEPFFSRIVQVADQAMKEGLIVGHSPRPNSWEEPAFVTLAHESSSACICELASYLIKDAVLKKCMIEKPVLTLVMIAVELLNKAGLEPYVTWSLRRDFPLQKDDIAPLIGRMSGHVTDDIVKNSDSLERFLHCLFNCTDQASEVAFQKYLTWSNTYLNLAGSFQKKENEI